MDMTDIALDMLSGSAVTDTRTMAEKSQLIIELVLEDPTIKPDDISARTNLPLPVVRTIMQTDSFHDSIERASNRQVSKGRAHLAIRIQETAATAVERLDTLLRNPDASEKAVIEAANILLKHSSTAIGSPQSQSQSPAVNVNFGVTPRDIADARSRASFVEEATIVLEG